MSGDARFHALLKEIGELHDRKQADYGRPDDPFHNLRASEEFGLPPDLGIALRMNDKMNRIKTYYSKGALVNDSVEDDFMDQAVYALAAIVLRREQRGDYNAENGWHNTNDSVCQGCGKLVFANHFPCKADDNAGASATANVGTACSTTKEEWARELRALNEGPVSWGEDSIDPREVQVGDWYVYPEGDVFEAVASNERSSGWYWKHLRTPTHTDGS